MIVCDIDDLPQFAEQRKTIVVLSENALSEAEKSYNTGSFLLDEKVYYICQLDENSLASYPALANLAKKGELIDGSIVMLNPYNRQEEYLPYKVLMKKTIQNQMLAFNELCQLLGAKNISWSISEESNQNILAGIGVDMPKVVNIEAKAKYGYTKNLSNEMKAETTFQRGNANLKKAESLIQSGIFEGNACILSFYRMAINNQDNPLKQQTLKIILNENISHQFEVLAKI